VISHIAIIACRERQAPQNAGGRLCPPDFGVHRFLDIESLIAALGGTITERAGSRVKITLLGEQWHCHRPHPGKEAKRYQVEEARELLERAGIKP
jgi:hypothetical protein